MAARPPTSELSGEQGDAGQEDAAPAEQVAGPGAEEQQPAEGEDVGVEHPRQPAAREAAAPLDVGQGHVHDGGVEHHHELGREDDEEEHRRVPEAAPERPRRSGGRSWPLRARRARESWRALTSTFPLVSLVSGSFLRLVYGGCLRLASRFLSQRSMEKWPASTATRRPSKRRRADQVEDVDRPDAGRRPAQLRAPGRGRPGGLRRRGWAVPPWRPSPARPASAWAPSTATSPSASTWSRPSTAPTSTISSQTAEQVVADLEPWPAVVAFLEAFVRYAQGKRTFLNELREAFEKNPDLRADMPERIDHAMELVVGRAQQAGVVRTDVDGSDVMQLVGPMCTNATLSEDQSTPAAGDDPRRTPQGAVARAPGAQAIEPAEPLRGAWSVATEAGVGSGLQ